MLLEEEEEEEIDGGDVGLDNDTDLDMEMWSPTKCLNFFLRPSVAKTLATSLQSRDL